MKAHKYWSLGALACMAGCFYTGCKKLMQAHKYFACGSLVCMGMTRVDCHAHADQRATSKILVSLHQLLAACVEASCHAGKCAE